MRAPLDTNAMRGRVTGRVMQHHKAALPAVAGAGLYLCLFNGVTNMSGAAVKSKPGPGGPLPVIGPLESGHVEWGETLRLQFISLSDASRFGLDPNDALLRIDGDMICFQGMFYSDWMFQFVSGDTQS